MGGGVCGEGGAAAGEGPVCAVEGFEDGVVEPGVAGVLDAGLRLVGRGGDEGECAVVDGYFVHLLGILAGCVG